MMADHHIRTHLQILQIPVSCIRSRQGCEFLSSVRHNHAPAAGLFDFINDVLNGLHIRPVETPGFLLPCRFASSLISYAEHSNSACIRQNQRLLCFLQIHACTDSFYSVLFGLFQGALHTHFACIHNVVVADIPDVRLHLLKHFDCCRIHGMHELLHTFRRSIGRLIHQRSFDICNDMISTVKKCKHLFRQQFLVIPFSIHIPVKSDITGKNQCCFISFYL